MNDGRASDANPVGDALAKLKEAMSASGSGTTDPDRRRAAAKLADLVRSDDDQLGRFARRHLPGREVDDSTLIDLRDLVVGIARLLALQGAVSDASSLTASVRAALFPRLEELERVASSTPREASRPVDPAPTPPDVAVVSTASRLPPPAPAPAFLTPPAVLASPPVAAPPVAVPQPGAAPARRQLSKALQQTVGVEAFSPGALDILPFSSKPAAPTAAPAPSPAALEPSPASALPAAGPAGAAPAKRQLSKALQQTVGVEAFSPGALDILPFSSKPAAPTAAPTPLVAAVTPSPASAPRAAGPAGAAPAKRQLSKALVETVGVDSMSVVGKTLPFSAPDEAEVVPQKGTPAALPPHLARIDAAAHAVFSALLFVYPEREAQIFVQYGVRDRAERELLDRHWLAKLGEDLALTAKWRERRDQAIAHYRAQR